MNPAALEKLHDFVEPPPPSWMPQTIGWYVLFAVLLLCALWALARSIRRWRDNRYRREALLELRDTPPAAFSALLKRTALAAWPRESVAALTGQAWLEFLNQGTDPPLFVGNPAENLEEFALRAKSELPPSDEQKLRGLVEDWIRRHRVRT